MMFASWLRQSFRSPVPLARAAGRAGARPAPRRRGARVETMEQRMLLTLVVNSVLDGSLASLKGDGKLELREAIELATHPNTTIDGYTTASLTNTIRFDPSLAGKTISLVGAGDASFGYSAFGLYGGAQLTIDGETGLNKGITLTRPNTIDIPGVAFPVPVPAYRLAAVGAGNALTLKGLTVSNFFAKGFTGGGGDSQSTGGGSAGMGGVIFNQGNLSLIDSTLVGNTAQGGAGGSVTYRYLDQQLSDGTYKRYTAHSGSGGAGIGADGVAAFADVGLGGNGGGPNGGDGGTRLHPDGWDGGTGGGGGGGLGENVSFDYGNGGKGGWGGGGGGGGEGDNVVGNPGRDGGAGGFGGGGGGGAHVGDEYGGKSGVGGRFGGNADLNLGGGGAGLGGAIFNWGGTVTLTNSTLTGNAARGGAGGSTPGTTRGGHRGDGTGGAISSFNGSLTIADSTIAYNTADDDSRGIYVNGSGGVAKLTLNNSIIGQNDTSVDHNEVIIGGLDGGSATLSGQSNLIRTLYVAQYVTGTLTGTVTDNPVLGTLQDNGGSTPTFALLAGSAAIDAGSNAAIAPGLTTDQRGDARIRNGTVDIGAVESRAQQTITFATLADHTYGDADFALSATSSSGLPVSFTTRGNVSVYQTDGAWYAHITGAGNATVTAIAAGNADYEAAANVSRSFTIAKAATVTTTVGGTFTYNGTAQYGGSGTVTGAGGLNSAASLTYSANADGSGQPDFVNAGTYYVTAHYAGDANHLASDGATVAVVINKAAATVRVAGYTGTYDGAAHGATGTATGVNGASVGTLNLGASFTNVPGGTAHWTFSGGQNYLDQQGDVAITILAKHITASFTAADKVYDGKTSAAVTSRSLSGVIGTDAVSLTGGAATFASKNVGTWTVSLRGATLGGAAAGNYVLDSVATATASISPRPLTGTATTQSSLNVASNGTLSFDVSVAQGGIVDGQSVAQLFDGASFALTVGGRTYGVRAQATARGGVVTVAFRTTDELKAILAASTTATNGGNAQSVALNLTAASRDGNYTLAATGSTKLFNTSK